MQELLPRLPCIHGQLNAALELWRAYPYSAPAHSWPPPSSRAVCSATISLNCRVSSPVFSHAHPQHRIHYRHAAFPTVVWCHTRCPLSNSVPKFQNQEYLPPLHIPMCVQRAELSELMPTTGTVLVEILCLPIVAPELAGIPLQPLTVVSTCPAHAFHPDTTSELAGQDCRPPGAADA